LKGKWQSDEDKLTFIILSRDSIDLDATCGQILPIDNRLAGLPMVGDVNMFLYGSIPSTEDLPTDEDDEDGFYAEVEIMIAGMNIFLTSLPTHNFSRAHLPTQRPRDRSTPAYARLCYGDARGILD